jgi:hypothetical protein
MISIDKLTRREIVDLRSRGPNSLSCCESLMREPLGGYRLQ